MKFLNGLLIISVLMLIIFITVANSPAVANSEYADKPYWAGNIVIY